jgi:cytochrome b
MIPLVIVIIAGLSGVEGLFFGEESAKNKGFETGSNYQRQSAIALLSYAFVAIIILMLDWGIKAELTIFFAFIFFFIFSGINHLQNAIQKKNYKWQNINRPFITLVLVLGMIYPIIKVISTI